jgi:hypothetical protein
MTKFCTIIILLLALSLTACKNGTQKEEPQKVDSDSVTVVKSDNPIYDRLLAELDSTEIYDDSILYGYWFKPHEACAVNIFFHKNGRFEFKYYIVENDTTIIDVEKKGTFKIGEADVNKARVVTMVADDGWDGNVFNGTIHYRCNRTHYYLEDKKSGLYLVKGSD